jgi:SAM-dependent methyltransferase
MSDPSRRSEPIGATLEDRNLIGPRPYSAWRATGLGAITERLEHDTLIGVAGRIDRLDVLDVGCGDGVLTGRLAAAGARVVGLDSDPAMIDVAMTKVARTAFVVGEAERLPFRPASFDLVVMNTVLCLVNDRAAAFGETSRVLRPDGRLVVGELGRWSLWAARRRIRGWLGACLWRHAEFSDAASLAAEITAAGLTIEVVRGAVYHPPWAWAARLMAGLDPHLGSRTTIGAAYIAVAARKS